MPDTVRTFAPPARTPARPLPAPPIGAAQRFGGRRSPLRLILGALLTVVAVLTFVTLDLRADHKRQVLAVTAPVAAGQLLTAADVVAVAVDAESGVPLLPASQAGTVIGRPAAVPLVRGELLDTALLGPAAFPPTGQAVLAVAVTAGHAPANLQPGSTVLVLVAPATTSGASTAPAAPVSTTATVMSAGAAADGSGDLDVSLLMKQDDAVTVAGQSGTISLILVAPAA